jgi:hypothetical protein
MTDPMNKPQPPNDDASASSERAASPEMKLVRRPPMRTIPADPIALLKTLSEEEKIALFS